MIFLKAFFLRHKKLHIWLLADCTLLAAFFAIRGHRSWMTRLNGAMNIRQGDQIRITVDGADEDQVLPEVRRICRESL